jgi:hypothetical protein
MRAFKISIYIALISLVFACNKTVTVAEFFKQVSEDKAYKKEVSIDEFRLTCNYRPAELICLSEIAKEQGDFKFNKNVFEETFKQYENACYMDLTIALNNGENVMMQGITTQSEYAARLGELTYLLTQDCYLLMDGKDTVKALTCNFSNTYSNTPNVKALLVFSKKAISAAKNTIDVVYADKTFGIPDKVVFTYTVADINKKIPNIIEQK